MRHPNPTILFTSLLVCCFAASGHASDGVLEINQTCASQTGCFPGDAAGYPVTIGPNAPASSFVLTSDLKIPDPNTHGIEIERDGVSLDLKGFALVGPVTCSGDPNVCVGGGTGSGILATNRAGITVRNGSVVGAGDSCVAITGRGHRVEDVNVRECGGNGIFAGFGAVVESSTSFRAGFFGVVASIGSTVVDSAGSFSVKSGVSGGNGAVIRGCSGNQNGESGIVAGYGATVENSAAYQNRQHGIVTSAAVTVRGSSAYQNLDTGIEARLGGSNLIDNTAADNGDGQITDHGISCTTTCSIQGNLSRDNDGFGIALDDATSGYSGNVTGGNGQGAVQNGTDLGGNLLN